MKVFIYSCVFDPEPVVSAQTSAQIARELSARGNQVQVITCFPSRPAGRLFAGYRKLPFTRERAKEGYAILRCFSFFSSHSNMISRFVENISFGIFSGLAALFSERPDVIYANTWPLLAQGIIWLVCRIRGIPLVLSVQDIYPESLLVQNRLPPDRSLIFKILRQMDTFITRHSHAVIVISEKFRQFYIQDRGLPADKVFTVPNWVDEIQTMTASTDHDIRRHHHIPEEAFLVVYGGNIGTASGIDKVIQAFDHLTEFENIYLLIAGDGPLLEHCRSMAQNRGDRHIVFHHPWRTDETSKVLRAADLLILPTQGEQSLVSVPSKLVSYMLAARPILTVAKSGSEIAQVVLRSGSGWVIPPGDPQELSRQIVRISTLAGDQLRQRGEAGKNFARRHYSMPVNLSKVIDILERAGRKVEHDPLDATC
jgi:colanic acid biosynthesis glycosyl transferase WcaI